jgi:hypothetical protein
MCPVAASFNSTDRSIPPRSAASIWTCWRLRSVGSARSSRRIRRRSRSLATGRIRESRVRAGAPSGMRRCRHPSMSCCPDSKGAFLHPCTMWSDAPAGHEDVPMGCMSWALAFAFCAWDGGRLPTLAEWNFAVACGDEQRENPWGPEPYDDTRAVYGELPGGALIPAGSKPAGRGCWGQYDFGGSRMEYVLDFIDVHNEQCAPPVPCVDCADLLAEHAKHRVLRDINYNNVSSSVVEGGCLVFWPDLQSTARRHPLRLRPLSRAVSPRSTVLDRAAWTRRLSTRRTVLAHACVLGDGAHKARSATILGNRGRASVLKRRARCADRQEHPSRPALAAHRGEIVPGIEPFRFLVRRVDDDASAPDDARGVHRPA